MDSTWKMVPVEPTEEMLNASVNDDQGAKRLRKSMARTAWQQMLKAAPLQETVMFGTLDRQVLISKEAYLIFMDREKGLRDELARYVRQEKNAMQALKMSDSLVAELQRRLDVAGDEVRTAGP